MNNIFALMQGGQATSGLDKLVGDLAGVVTRQVKVVGKDSVRGLTMATESLAGDAAALGELSGLISGLNQAVGGAITSAAVNLNTMGLESIQGKLADDIGNSLGDISMQAAASIAAAFANPQGYAEAATRKHSTPGGHIRKSVATEGVGGHIVHAPAMALEKFSEQNVRDMAGWSIVMAATGAKLDDFCEAWFNYILVGAGDMGLTVTLARSMIVQSPTFDQSGAPNDLDRVNLIDAARNPELLDDESTRLYPVLHQDTTHESRRYFVAGAAADSVTVEGNTFNTAPLKFGEVGLIPVSTPDYLIAEGVMELSDALGNGGGVKYILLEVGGEFIRVPVRELAGFGFLPGPEGTDTRQVINTHTKSVILDGKTKNDRRQESAALKLLRDNDLVIRLSVGMNGDVDLTTNVCYMNGDIRSVLSVTYADGTPVNPTGGIGQEALELAASVKAVGWYPDMVRSNENKRTLGKLFDTIEERWAYAIPLTSPYSVIAPTGSNQPAKNLETLIAAQRKRMHAHGVTTLLNHFSNIEAAYAAKKAGQKVAEIGSVGARLTNPYHKRIFIDARQTQSLRDNDKALDLAAKIVNVIRYHAAEMAVESGFVAALEGTTRGSKKLKMIIGTSIPLHQQLMTTGDLRTFGPLFDNCKIVSTLNKNMDGKILVSFTRDAEPNHPDELVFGWCPGLPELVTIIDTRRGGSTRKEATTQGRWLFIPNLPFGFEVVVSHLEEGLIDPSIYRTTEVDQNGNPVTGQPPFPGPDGGQPAPQPGNQPDTGAGG